MKSEARVDGGETAAVESLPEADVIELRDILQSYHGDSDLTDHVRIRPNGGHGLLQISETGQEESFQTVAWIRDGATIRVAHLVDNGPLVLEEPEIVPFPARQQPVPDAESFAADASATEDDGLGGLGCAGDEVFRDERADMVLAYRDAVLRGSGPEATHSDLDGLDVPVSSVSAILQELIAQDSMVL